MTQKRTASENVCAVVMGDLVLSTRAPDVAQLHNIFNRAIARHNDDPHAAPLSPLTITLGDEFQGLAKSLLAGMKTIRSLRFELLLSGVECRFALGTARIETPINHVNAWNMMGPGLAEARARLNEKADRSRYRFSLPERPSLEVALNAIGASLTAVEVGWTETQRNDVIALLSGKSVEEVARIRNVSIHSVYKVRDAGHFAFYAAQWAALHEVLARLDDELELTS